MLDTDFIDIRTPVIILKGFDKNDILNVSQKLLDMHSDAYKWDANSKIEAIIENIADEAISNAGLTGGRVTARNFIRKFITLLDTVEQNQSHFNSSDDVLREFIENTGQIDVDEFDEFDDDW